VDERKPLPVTPQNSEGCAASNPLGMFIPASEAGTAVTVSAKVMMVAWRFSRTTGADTRPLFSST